MENMKKLPVLSCVLLLAIALLAPGCKKKEDASDKEQKSEVKVSAEETVKASEEKMGEFLEQTQALILSYKSACKHKRGLSPLLRLN